MDLYVLNGASSIVPVEVSARQSELGEAAACRLRGTWWRRGCLVGADLDLADPDLHVGCLGLCRWCRRGALLTAGLGWRRLARRGIRSRKQWFNDADVMP